MNIGKLPPDLLERLLDTLNIQDPRVLVSPLTGEDTAVIDMGDHALVAKSAPLTFATDLIGWYAVQVNANDVACMGAVPKWFLATILLPENAQPQMAENIFNQTVAALAVTPSIQPYDLGQDDIRIVIRPTDRETAIVLFRLVSQLQRDLDRHDQRLRNAYLTAPEPVRQELRIAHREVQKKYRGLIHAMSMAARGSDAPVSEGTLQNGR